ncbi:hypothetical protein BH18ACT2_BH18ACT2_00640 [soil metagenome]
MPIDPEAQELRRRAVDLRRLAARIDAVRLQEVEAWAGPDTWRSAGAEQCRALLAGDGQRLVHAADELRERAWRLDRQADALDALALAASVLPNPLG